MKQQNTGTYLYDGWGNIHQMGNAPDQDWFRYDHANRLVRASVQDPSGQRTLQDYDYDAFGNITEVVTWPPGQSGQTVTIAVNANTNRLSSAGYDASGNMTSWGSDSYTYNTGNQMVKQNGRWYFLYTFSGERIATIDWQGSIATREVDWTIRGPSNQVLSTFRLTGEDQAGNWSREIDYIWMGRRLSGTEDGSGTQKHYHTDHLGSIRLITDSAGNKISEHEYLPYGQELTAAGNGVMKFTGHERDADTGMDYMHARFYQEHLGRFMSVDPVLGNTGSGGSWNRYGYVRGGPLGLTDPTGMAPAQTSQRCHYSSGVAIIYGALTGGCAPGGIGSEPTSAEIFDALVNVFSPVKLNMHPFEAHDKKEIEKYLADNPDEAEKFIQHLESEGLNFDADKLRADETINVTGTYMPLDSSGVELWEGWDDWGNNAWEAIVEGNPNEFDNIGKAGPHAIYGACRAASFVGGARLVKGLNKVVIVRYLGIEAGAGGDAVASVGGFFGWAVSVNVCRELAEAH